MNKRLRRKIKEPEIRFFPENFRRNLMDWYDANHRILPWRKTKDPYLIWVSEVMLQQTRVDTVLPYYVRFIQRFPTLDDLAGADLQEVLKKWEGLGYYARARNLHAAGQSVVKDHNSKVPDNYDSFRALPGVGDYIASAVLSMAFDLPYAVVDGNVKRVLGRLLLMDTPVNQPKSHSFFASVAKRLLDQNSPGRFNQSVMELGALICTPGRPDCTACPVSVFCAAFSNQAVLEYPKKIPSKKKPVRKMAAALVIHGNRIFLSRRPAKGLLGGMWEPVCVELEQKELPASACKRFLNRNLNLKASDFIYLGVVLHSYTHFNLEAHVFACRGQGSPDECDEAGCFKWMDLNELSDYPLHRAAQKMLALMSKTGV